MEYVNTFRHAKTESETKVFEVLNSNQYVIEKLSSLDIKILALEKYIKSLSLDGFLNIIEKRINAYKEDLYKPLKFHMGHDEEVNNKYGKDSVSFGIYEGILMRHLEELYGNVLAQLIFSPIIAEVKVTKVEIKPYIINKDQSVGQKIILAEIQDIIKGNNHLKIGATIEFYYMPFWTNTGNEFICNEVYFILLFPVISNKNGDRRLALNVNEVNGGIVRISQNILIDDDNYYGFGRIPWSEFKNKIVTKIDIKQLKGE